MRELALIQSSRVRFVRLAAKGSGIWFNTGKTIAFAEHADAYKHFGVSQGGDMNVKLSKAAAAKGYDSIQFTAHKDHVNYPCDTAAGVPYMNIEIVGVKLSGASACCTPTKPSPFSVPAFRRGLKAEGECTCDTSQGYLNCAHVPNAGSDEFRVGDADGRTSRADGVESTTDA